MNDASVDPADSTSGPHCQRVKTCSFCDKRQEQVERLIGGPRGVAICNECVRLCVEILDEGQQQHT